MRKYLRYRKALGRLRFGRGFGVDFLSMLVSNVGKVVIQGLYFVIIARMLGASEFGAFATLVAVSALAAPLASLGTMQLMVRNVSQRGARPGEQLSLCLVVTAVSGTIMVAILGAVGHAISPESISRIMMVQVFVADLLCVRLVEAVGSVYQALKRMRGTALATITLHGGRLLAATLVMVGVLPGGLRNWVTIYLTTTLVMTSVVIISGCALVGLERPDLKTYRTEFTGGLHFCFGLAAQSVYNDIDKVMLGKLSTLSSVGIYTAAYRVVDMGFSPMRSLLGASFPRFFDEGRQGLRSSVRYARKLADPGLTYCLLASASLFLGAGVLPIVLGASFRASVGALRGLALLPLIKGAQYLLADALSGAGKQAARSIIQVSVAIVNIVLNALLLRPYSWKGAIFTSLFSDGILLLSLFLLSRILLRREVLVQVGKASTSTVSSPA